MKMIKNETRAMRRITKRENRIKKIGREAGEGGTKTEINETE